MFHGSPCQSFSTAGKGEGGDKGSGTKSSLMWESVRIISESMPKVVIWENVKGVLSKNHIHNFNSYIEELSKLGYKTTYKLITPRDIGECQSRPRVFVVSMLEHEFVFPEYNVKECKPIGHYLEEGIVDEKYILSKESADVFAHNNPKFTGRMKVLRHDELAGCLVAKSGKAARTNNYVLYDKNNYINMKESNNIQHLLDNDIRIRCLTPIEYWRLQGFSDEQFYIARRALADTYKKGDVSQTDAQLYKQAGNSINVKVLESFIGKVLNTLYK